MLGPYLIRNEAVALRTMDHPHVVRCLGTGTGMLTIAEDADLECAEPACYVALEHLSGGTLLDAIQSGRTGPDKFTRSIFRDLAETLKYIHATGWAHRDIKPDNVMFDSSGRCSLIDFGLVCPAYPATGLSYETVGSRLYWAPELYYVGYPYGYVPTAADVYALGMTLFEMLYHFAPFYAPHPWWNVRSFQEPRFWQEVETISGAQKDPLARDLLGRMLMPNPLFRPSLEDVLRHPWLAAGDN